MYYILPINPEPASRIYAGGKPYEFRKASVAGGGYVYLYETTDVTGTVRAIRGGFSFSEAVSLPIKELWERFGVHATSKERFDKYFMGYKRGTAMLIERVDRFERPVDLRELQVADPTFLARTVLRGLTKLSVDSVALSFLERTPRSEHFFYRAPSAERALRVSRLEQDEHAMLFKNLYDRHVKPSYPESEDYAETVLASHFGAIDPYGYFTKKKTVWCFFTEDQSQPVGFTVVTEKRGGSIKFGPSVIDPVLRGLGLGSAFRLLVEKEYPHARKAYNTLPDDSPAALSYVLKAGYQIEAHLASQYRSDRGEIVVGKFLQIPKRTVQHFSLTRELLQGPLTIKSGVDVEAQSLQDILEDTLSYAYEEIDANFAAAVQRAACSPQLNLSKKSKRVFVAYRASTPVGVLIVTPKRGHALKCTLALKALDSEAFSALLRQALCAFPERELRKFYMHVPDFDTWMLAEAKADGFSPEGILRQPYKVGVDMVVLGKLVERV